MLTSAHPAPSPPVAPRGCPLATPQVHELDFEHEAANVTEVARNLRVAGLEAVAPTRTPTLTLTLTRTRTRTRTLTLARYDKGEANGAPFGGDLHATHGELIVALESPIEIEAR